jgi:NTP pyrophosphatase (non-canonical NTP hydrolase)
MNVLEKAISKWGKDLQQVVALEELSELQKEITKAMRGKGNTERMIEEIADVLIMIEQLKIIHNISDHEVEYTKDRKLQRLERLLSEC